MRLKKRWTKSLPSTKITERVSQVLRLSHRNFALIQCAAQYSATQINTKINEIQKQIGVKRKAKEDADDLMKQKVVLEKEKKSLIESAAEKEVTLKKKIGTIGNIVHDSVPVNNDEVFQTRDGR
jgi:seryl-tRNA synthetase